jgi:hypothetical protein
VQLPDINPTSDSNAAMELVQNPTGHILPYPTVINDYALKKKLQGTYQVLPFYSQQVSINSKQVINRGKQNIKYNIS